MILNTWMRYLLHDWRDRWYRPVEVDLSSRQCLFEMKCSGRCPNDEYEVWPGILSPCRKSSRRGDGVTSIVSFCSFPQALNPLTIWIFDPRGLWPDSTNHHVGIVWAFCVVYISQSLMDVSKERRVPSWTGNATA